MVNMAKRIFTSTRRPIAKFIKHKRQLNVPATQDSFDIRLAAMSETFVGGNISISWASGAVGTVLILALILLREGDTTNSLLLSNGDLYQPEENVLWSRSFVSNSTTQNDSNISDKIKTMRKLKQGDKIILKQAGSSADNGDMDVIVTGFVKQ